MIKLAAFDFDGTIADSVELCLSTFEELFREMPGERTPDREELFQQFGRNEEGILHQYYHSRTAEAFAGFCRLHEKLHRTMCPEPFPGMKELLLTLKSRGLKLVLLTGRSEETAQISMRILQLTGIFDDFRYGSVESTDKSLQMRQMLERFRLRPEEAIYVGDAVSDAKSSFDAGLVCLSAAWAKSARRADLERINPGFLFDSIAAMQKWLVSEI